MYAQGASTEGLAVHFGVHRTTAMAHLAARGVARRRNVRKMNEGAVARAAELYTSGLSLAAVASESTSAPSHENSEPQECRSDRVTAGRLPTTPGPADGPLAASNARGPGLAQRDANLRHAPDWRSTITRVTYPEPAAATFRRLHAHGCFVMPNPWDAGTARALEQMGFKALATTSAGLAWTLGRSDNQVTLEQALEHLQIIAGAVNVPVNADFEDGYAVDPAQVAANVKLAAATGITGLSIEDSTRDPARPLHDMELAIERIRAARQAIDETATDIVLTGRSEGFVCGENNIEDTIMRLSAYADAGADCLYAPRIESVEHIAAIVAAVSPKPVNLLINSPFITVAQAADLGVRRVSVGGTMARAAWAGFLDAAHELAEAGTVSRFVGLPNVDQLLHDG
jgi:2-methylisocitrate lyase-like PEP mutase family enzyme